jgi:NAD+ synthetase
VPRLPDFALPEDLDRWTATITAFIRRHVEAAGAKGVVLGASGGLDSALVAALCVEALGKSKVLPVLLPSKSSNPLDAKHARLSCKSLGLKPLEFGISPVVDAVDDVLGKPLAVRERGNAKSRTRMLLLYALAQQADSWSAARATSRSSSRGTSRSGATAASTCSPSGTCTRRRCGSWPAISACPSRF